MFNSYGHERLTEWKKFRDSLEEDTAPLEKTVSFWCRAPFVSPYLNPLEPKTWPDPWHLILDDKFDSLAIIIGMQYTLQLTRRFMNCNFEIHMSTEPNLKEKNYSLRVDNHVLNLEYGSVLSADELEKYQTSIIWSNSGQK